MLRPSLPLALLFTVIACGDRADAPNQVDSAPPVDSTPVPEPVAPTLDGDALSASVKLRCEDGGTWMATYWVGPGARVVLSSESAGFVLPQVVAASGIRYTDANERNVWWAKGDTATFTRGRTTTTCVIDPTVNL